MPIPFRCPHCGLETQVDERFAGKSGPCAGCGQTITVPGAPANVGPTAPRASNRSNLPIILGVVASLIVGGLAFVSILVALLLPAIQAAREAARRTACINQMKQISFAMLEYEAVNGSLPPAYTQDENGRPMHSWRVLLLPYLGPEAQNIYNQYDLNAPWDSPQNQRLAIQMPAIYRCPSDPIVQAGDANYFVVTGAATVFPGAESTRIEDLQDKKNLSQTLLLVEAKGTGINWLEPRDITDAQLTQGINSGMVGGCGSHHVGGMCTAFADGHVAFLPDSTNPEDLLEMAQVPPAPNQ